MLFGTYGAPPSAPRQTNPLLIVLGVCGGCVLIVIIGFAGLAYFGYNAAKGLINGAVQMQKTMPAFLSAMENHNYSTAASLVDPSAQNTLTEDALKSMEEKMESKLGPMQSFPARFSRQTQNTVTGPNGQPQAIEYVYQYPVQYKKGRATATFKFRTEDMQGSDISKMKFSGKVTGFKLEAGGGSSDGNGASSGAGAGKED